MSPTPLRIAFFGASGRMGAKVLSAAAERSDLTVELLLVRPDSPKLGMKCPLGSRIRGGDGIFETASQASWEGIDAVLDFSSPDGLRAAIEQAGHYRIPLVSGTTPFTAELECLIDDLALRVPVLHAANFSRGIWALTRVLPKLRSWLNDSFEAGILEIHHASKKDAPSGTARVLASAWDGDLPVRPAIASLRLGRVIGDHAFWIEGRGERIEIWHRVQDRRVFAEGALDAVQALAGRPPGRYTLDSLWAEGENL